MMNHHSLYHGLYAIVDDVVHASFGLEKLLQDIIKHSTIQFVQLRLKTLPQKQKTDLIDFAIALKSQRSFFLIINDDTDFLEKSGVDGAHLGQTDGDLSTIRKKYPRHILGSSVNSVAEALEAQSHGANYLGCGALFTTNSKDKTRHLPLGELQRIAQSTHLPKIGIGGISAQNMYDALNSGCDMVAMISGLIQNQDFMGGIIHKLLCENKNTAHTPTTKSF